jgi:hypothetical protein
VKILTDRARNCNAALSYVQVHVNRSASHPKHHNHIFGLILAFRFFGWIMLDKQVEIPEWKEGARDGFQQGFECTGNCIPASVILRKKRRQREDKVKTASKTVKYMQEGVK